jgi:hypothetical protein
VAKSGSGTSIGARAEERGHEFVNDERVPRGDDVVAGIEERLADELDDSFEPSRE